MKQPRQYPIYQVSPKGDRWLSNGHPWVYETDIVVQPEEVENGALVDVVSSKGKYIGTGFVSTNSKIRVRIVSSNANDTFDEAFWKRRLEYAWNYRKQVMSEEDLDACRIIFGESDQFPGLTVDKFHDLLVIQTLSIGMEKRKHIIFPMLVKMLREDGYPIKGIYERNDDVLREKEGMTQGKGWYDFGEPFPDSVETIICENGVQYHVDVENGQKTGFFLDQKYNRRAVAAIAKGRTVLDVCTHTGSFALNAAKGGAKRVTAVDISALAIEQTQANIALNHLEDVVDTRVADVFDLLPELQAQRHPYDFIILDPPAFTKSRSTIESAMRGYKQINMRAMQLLPRGGYLATASCSHFASEERFIKMLHEAAKDANRQLRQIEVRQQACDHPILWNVEETNYLKFFLFQVI